MSHDSTPRVFTPNEAVSQQDSASSYSCTHCVLIFKTRFYLYEHLHQVHGLGIEAALKDSGLNSLPQSKSKPDNRFKPIKSNFAFNCKTCSFKSSNWSIFSKHKKQCRGISSNENPVPKASVFFEHQKSPTNSKEIPNVKETRKSTSKDVKSYSKSPQTITKYFTAASSIKSNENAKEIDAKTLRLEDSSSKSCGVFQVTATSIDMAKVTKNSTHLLSDLISDPTSAKPVDPFKEATLNNPSKRTSKECEEYYPSKKAKLEMDHRNHTQTSNCADLSFEVSDDDEVKDLSGEETKHIQYFFCKHCDFKSVSMEHVYNHYEENHPYLRYSSFYIEEKSDQSATFRCLECPIEFSSDVHLRCHYNTDHPDIPDVFNLKSTDLNLVYKCFVCSFTSNSLHSLREHHKENHPSHNVENPLLYCKYSSHSISVTTQRNSEKNESLENFEDAGTTETCQDKRIPSISPKPKSKTQAGTLYYCGKCTYSHKSVVVLHVHYKKCHPEEPITLDKIKQSVGVRSITASPQTPRMEIDLPQSFVKQDSSASPLSDSVNISECISVNPNLQPALTAKLDNTTSSSFNEKMFFCDRCDFFNSNVKSVISHHNAKHGLKTTIEDILRYTAAMESKNEERVSTSMASVSNSVANAYSFAQDLYYCQVCNYGNPSLKGLLNHQNKVHETCKSKERILEYTAKIHDQIEKSKSHPDNSILPSGLPLPLIRGKSALSFCYLCNYRHKNIALINRHFFKVHKGCRINSHQIVAHTSMIYERLNARQIQSTEQNQEGNLADAEKKMKITKPIKPRHEVQSEVRLKCLKCSYAACHIYLMRKHLISWHKTNMSFSDIVQLCGAGAHFEPGYYCDVCAFRCEEITEVKSHGQQRHCGRSLSFKFMSTQLYLSPDICNAIKSSNFLKNSDTPDNSSPLMFPESYSCKICSFKGTSFSDITSHYQTIHPYSAKDGGDLLDISNGTKKQSLSKTELDYNDCQQDFDPYQEPLDFDNLNVSGEAAKEYSCSYCPSTFAGRGGLIIHIGMKHRDKIEETPQLAKRVQIFKCRCCSYVHNIRSGVLTHTKMKHSNKALKSDHFYVDCEHLNVEMKVKNGNWKFCGYICRECSHIYPSKDRLNEHRKTHKKQPVVNMAADSKPIHERIWCQFCGLCCASAKDLSIHLRVCQKNSRMYPCTLCQDAFCTKVQLGLHYTKKHGEKAFFKHYAPLYNQPFDKTAAQPKEISNGKVNAVLQTEKICMFKCPSCRYVNSRHHGTLTHCQMRHPNIVVRAETLKTLEIDVGNMIGHLPNSKTYGGFRCRKCPLIYGELKKLKKHCETDHNPTGRASSKLLAHTQQQPVVPNTESESASSSQTKFVTKFRHFFKCSMCSFSTSILKTLGRHYRSRHGKSAYTRHYSPLFHNDKNSKSSVKYEETRKTEPLLEKAEETHEKTTLQMGVYKCNICSYSSPYRRYLIAHFRNRHKLDNKAINKQMEKFKNWESTLPAGRFNCRKCLNVFFASKGRLLVHYGSVHSSEIKMDFTIVSGRTHRSTGVYRCNHCKEKLFGIKNICSHLDQHRTRLIKMEEKTVERKIVEVSEGSPPSLFPEEEEIKLEAKSEETMKDPRVSTASLFAEVPQKPSEAKHICVRCKRTFMSLKGLRSHERSHAAFDNLTTSNSQKHIDQYVVYRPGTTRPYMCTLCSYRTTVLALGKSHFLKKHPYVSRSAEVKPFEEEAPQNKEAGLNVVGDLNFDGDEEAETSFLEPPDVQRQLKHYNIMAQIYPASKTQNIQLSDSRMLPCEMCNFNSHHYSNMRRHYLRRHGKKLIRCKDCNFFTCFKQNLDLHEQMGHYCVQSEPTHQKNLCCPFCLYQSKNKDNMIDHIVLHREERMMPIEVRRSKLSRYLQGIVFRCYKCTFTSGSAESLDLHMAKHNDLKPFKCRLCYFDCTQLRDLEAHLCDKHQVVRNHQLVGQISLDQLEERENSNSHEVLHDPQNEEQALKKEQPNKEISESAELPIKENERIENILMDDKSPDITNSPSDSKQETKSNSEMQETFTKDTTEEKCPYGEMPILEKYFKEQHFLFAQHSENSEKLCSRDRCIEEDSAMGQTEYDETQNPPILLATDSVAAVHTAVAATTFPCDLCGRSLANTSELQRHMMRHGM